MKSTAIQGAAGIFAAPRIRNNVQDKVQEADFAAVIGQASVQNQEIFQGKDTKQEMKSPVADKSSDKKTEVKEPKKPEEKEKPDFNRAEEYQEKDALNTQPEKEAAASSEDGEVSKIEKPRDIEDIPEETVARVEDFLNKLKEAFSKELSITEEELLAAMEKLGFTVADFVDPETVNTCIRSLCGAQSVTELLVDEELYMTYSRIQSDIMEFTTMFRPAEDNLSLEELQQLLLKLEEMQEAEPGLEGNLLQEAEVNEGLSGNTELTEGLLTEAESKGNPVQNAVPEGNPLQNERVKENPVQQETGLNEGLADSAKLTEDLPAEAESEGNPVQNAESEGNLVQNAVPEENPAQNAGVKENPAQETEQMENPVQEADKKPYLSESAVSEIPEDGKQRVKSTEENVIPKNPAETARAAQEPAASLTVKQNKTEPEQPDWKAEEGKAEPEVKSVTENLMQMEQNTDTTQQNLLGNQYQPQMQSAQFKAENVFQPEMPFTSFTNYDGSYESIIRQVAEQVRVRVTEDTSMMEMHLNPESLGKLSLSVELRQGMMTARFVAESEQVKEAIESQAALLREDLDRQGVKVEAIEVAVEAHEFERNLEQGQQHGQAEEEARNAENERSRNRRNLNLDFLEEEEELTEAEDLAAKIMRENGNTMDYFA